MCRVLIILLVFPSILMAQYTPKEIDSLMTKEYYRLRSKRKFQEIISLSKLVIRDSKKINYLKGEIYGYARLGNMQCSMKNYKEALQSLNYANKLIEDSNIKDNVIKASIHLGTGICYSEPGTSYQNAKYEYDKAIFFAEKITNKEEKKFYLYLIYSNLYGLYSNIKNKEKEVFYLRKALSIKKSPYMLTELARYHNIYSKNSDSARFYLEKSQKLSFTDFDKAALYNQWGKYYEENKEYQKAIDFYKKNELLAIKTKEAPLQEDALIGLYNCNTKIGDLKKAIFYSERRNKFKDSMSLLKLENSNVAINDILKKKENIINKKFSITQRIFAAFSILALLVFVFLGIKIYRNKKESNKVQKLMQEKEIELREKEDLAENLQLKVNDSFHDLVRLAKENAPEFYAKFKEIYPDVIAKILKIDPKLRISELTLCAYIFLGFNTKDIARYTYKSTNTIRNRKFNLKKKLQLQENDDIERWFKQM